MHYERVSLACRGGSWRMSYRAVYDAERKGDRKWATIGAAASRAEAEHLAAEYLYNLPRDPEDERRAEAIEATEGRMPTVGELRRDDIDHALAVGAITARLVRRTSSEGPRTWPRRWSACRAPIRPTPRGS